MLTKFEKAEPCAPSFYKTIPLQGLEIDLIKNQINFNYMQMRFSGANKVKALSRQPTRHISRAPIFYNLNYW